MVVKYKSRLSPIRLAHVVPDTHISYSTNITYSTKYQYQYNIYSTECVILHQLHTSGVCTTHHNTATLPATTSVLPQHHIYNNLCITYNRIATMYQCHKLCATLFTYRFCSEVSELNSPDSSDVN